MAPSLWAKYSAELTDGQTTFIERPWGFISYSLTQEFPDSVFAADIYIEPDHRDAAHAYELLGEVERLGRADGRTHTIFVVNVTHANAAWCLRLYLGLGFKPFSAHNGIIWLKRPFSPVKE